MKFGLIGSPINYSLSPQIHQQFAKQFNIELNYQLIPTTIDHLEITINELQQQGFVGVNVTQPLKQKIIAYATQQSDLVLRTQAANTLTFNSSNTIFADNTDGIGFYNAIKNHVPHDIKNKTVLLIGAGGAASGILPMLLKFCPQKIMLLNRTIDRSQKLIEQYPEINMFKSRDSHQWVINATAIPCYELPKYFPQLSFESSVLYDLTYNHDAASKHDFCRERQPLAVYDGLTMLVEQAATAFKIWHGVSPETAAVVKKLDGNQY